MEMRLERMKIREKSNFGGISTFTLATYIPYLKLKNDARIALQDLITLVPNLRPAQKTKRPLRSFLLY